MRECPLCSSAAPESPYARVSEGDYLRCPGCGLVYVAEIAPAHVRYPAYAGGRWKAWRRRTFAPFRRFAHYPNFEESMARANRIRAFVDALRPDRREGATWLDVGCNKGFLLAAAIASGWDIWGVELVPELTIPFRRKFDRFSSQVLSGSFRDAQARLPDGFFDVATAIDLIEHVEDPVGDMNDLARVLRPDGLLVVQTPDCATPRALAEGERWGALKPLEHLHLFDAANLELLARKAGFTDLRRFPAFEEADGNLVAVLGK